MTNYERIKSMTIDEVAKFLLYFDKLGICSQI